MEADVDVTRGRLRWHGHAVRKDDADCVLGWLWRGQLLSVG